MLPYFSNSKGRLERSGLLFIEYLLESSIFCIHLKINVYNNLQKKCNCPPLQMSKETLGSWVNFLLFHITQAINGREGVSLASFSFFFLTQTILFLLFQEVLLKLL